MLPIDSGFTTGVSAAGLAFDPASLSDTAKLARQGDAAGLEAAARAFESLMIGQMLKRMRTTSLSEGLFDSEQTKLYQELQDQQLAATLAEGDGLGIRAALVRQLSPSVARSGQARPELKLPERNPALDRVRQPSIAARSRDNTAAVTEIEATTRSKTPTAPVSTRSADRWPPANPEEFVAYLKPHAEQAARELGVDPHVLLAQSALESGWGRHIPRHADGQSSFNLFGIKAHRAWRGDTVTVGTLEYRNGVAQREQARFRAYASPTESFNDYVAFLKRNPRYRGALASRSDRDFVHGLQQAGYATDPQYAAKILSIRDRLRDISATANIQVRARSQVSESAADEIPKG